MNTTLQNPAKLVFGTNSFQTFISDLIGSGHKRLFILTVPEVLALLQEGINRLKSSGCQVETDTTIRKEPSFTDYKQLLAKTNKFTPDCVAGIGGGSVLDTAKLIATTAGSDVKVEDFLKGTQKFARTKKLICLPTTSGTGSEVSPNAIFIAPETGDKIGVIDPQLVPDATYIDPLLTLSVPPSVTAATGLDALTHCIEAYVNNFSTPVVDLWALEGIKLIGQNLKKAFDNGNNTEAREKMALGSMYGGMCLGPVNTAAVHALAYPLGSTFKIAHGVSNAMLLPFVLEYNLECAVEKYANIAQAIGINSNADDKTIAKEGINKLKEMIAYFKIPGRLSDLGIEKKDIVGMAHSAMKVQRLLKNNVREIKLQDAIDIYTKAL